MARLCGSSIEDVTAALLVIFPKSDKSIISSKEGSAVDDTIDTIPADAENGHHAFSAANSSSADEVISADATGMPNERLAFAATGDIRAVTQDAVVRLSSSGSLLFKVLLLVVFESWHCSQHHCLKMTSVPRLAGLLFHGK